MKYFIFIFLIVNCHIYLIKNIDVSLPNNPDDYLLTTAIVQEQRIIKCYGELGCFSTNGPFFDPLNRPLNLLPENREIINTQFILYTRQNSAKGQSLKVNDVTSIKNSNFDSSNPTVFIIHGFLDSGFKEWVKNMVSAFLIRGNYNVIAVDWSGGSQTLYTQATANTRLVGAEIALIINFLKDEFGLDPNNSHIIGHSLGAHTAGYAGERIENLGRITGLDPAEPYFKNTDPVVRLDPSDATFVDVIHTDIKSILELGFGIAQPVGHLDFYPNGGYDQPGCEKQNVVMEVITSGIGDGAAHFVACNHLRSYILFTDTIHHFDNYLGIECSSYKDLLDGNCNDCGLNSEKCMVMGLMAKKPNNKRQLVKLYLQTKAAAPFYVHHFNAEVKLGSQPNPKNMLADIYISIFGTQGNINKLKLSSSSISVAHDKVYNFFFSVNSFLGDITRINFYWEYNYSLLNPITWPIWKDTQLYIDEIRITSFEAKKRYFFCGENQPVKNKENKIYNVKVGC